MAAGKSKKTAASKKKEALEKRRALVDSILGKYAWIPYTSDDFNRDKRREIALENRA